MPTQSQLFIAHLARVRARFPRSDYDVNLARAARSYRGAIPADYRAILRQIVARKVKVKRKAPIRKFALRYI